MEKEIKKIGPQDLEKVSGFFPANTKSVKKYTPDRYKEIFEESLWPVFNLKSLFKTDRDELRKISRRVANSEAQNQVILDAASRGARPQNFIDYTDDLIELWEICFRAVDGWKMFDSQGEEIECTLDNFKELPDWLKDDLFGKIMDVSTLKGAEVDFLS